MKRELMRLRVPRGWTVMFNRFEEFVPAPGDEGDFLELTEDLLQVSSGPDGYTIDLGWYPDGRPDGRYGLTVVRPDFSGVEIVRVDHRDQYVIRAAVEACALAITGGAGVAGIAATARAAVSACS